MKAHVPEAEILTSCRRWLDAHGIFHWRNSTGCAKIGTRFVSFGFKGSSDLLGVLPDGRFLAVETKAEGGRLSPEQRDFLEAVRRNRGVAIVAKSTDDLEAAIGDQCLLPLECMKKDTVETREKRERSYIWETL